MAWGRYDNPGWSFSAPQGKMAILDVEPQALKILRSAEWVSGKKEQKDNIGGKEANKFGNTRRHTKTPEDCETALISQYKTPFCLVTNSLGTWLMEKE